MRKVSSALTEFFVADIADIVHKQSQNDGEQCCSKQIKRTEDQRVADGPAEVDAAEETLEPVKAEPIGTGDAGFEGILLKRHDDAGHRQILEQQQVYEPRKGQQKHIPVIVQPFSEAFFIHTNGLLSKSGSRRGTRGGLPSR